MSLLSAGRPSREQNKFLKKLSNAKEITTTSFRFDKDFYRELKQYAMDHDLNISEVIYKAVRAYMNNEEQTHEHSVNYNEISNALGITIESLIEISNKVDKLK